MRKLFAIAGVRCLIAFASAVLANESTSAATYQGLEPGRASRVDAEAKLGAPLATGRPSLFKYAGGADGIREVFVDYSDSGVVDRIDVYFTAPVERAAIVRALGISSGPSASDRRANSIDEYYATDGIILTYTTASIDGGVAAVSYAQPASVGTQAAEVNKMTTAGPPPVAPCSNPNGSDNCVINSGKTLDYFPMDSASACQAACADDARCSAWTFVKPGGYAPGDPPMCYRIADFSNLVQHPCCASGWKTGSPMVPEVEKGTGDATTPALALEVVVDRPGADYTSFDLADADPSACASRCGEDVQCHAFTYVKPGVQGPKARCWLKSTVPAAVARDCCVSGVK